MTRELFVWGKYVIYNYFRGTTTHFRRNSRQVAGAPHPSPASFSLPPLYICNSVILAPSPESSWISCGHSGNFLEIFVIVPSSYRKRIAAWANAKLPYIAWENCSGQNKGLFQAQNRKITMKTSENRNFWYSVVLSVQACEASLLFDTAISNSRAACWAQLPAGVVTHHLLTQSL